MNIKLKKKLKAVLVVTGILFMAAAMCLLCAWPVIEDIIKLKKEADEYVMSSTPETFSKNQASFVYDSEGSLLFSYNGGKDMQYVEMSEIPQVLADAFVVMEDRRFYEHRGVDYKAIIRSFVENYKADSIVQGASTITQQLARNIFLNQDVNYSRKIEEIFIAYGLEKKYDKNQIMEYYLNNIYFGNGFYGVQSAAWGYFGKNVSELSTGECILLAAIPNNPSKYELFDNEEAAVERARIILKEMYNQNKISELDYIIYSTGEGNTFVTSNVMEKMKELSTMTTAKGYVYTYITNCAVKYIMKANGFVFENDFASESERMIYEENYDYWYSVFQQRLFTGGYSIYTSIDMDAQNKLQEVMDEKLSVLDKEDGTMLQGGAVCIDNETGLVVAAVGGRTEECLGYGFNRAYQSYRQPGSAIKPLNVYTPYFCAGHSPFDIVEDVYTPSGPRNAGNSYAGEITLEEAIKYSKNTVAWNIYKELGPLSCMNFLIRLGFKNVYMDMNLQAGALGGFTYGVSPEEMAGGYAAIYNDGIYRVPTCIEGIYSQDGILINIDYDYSVSVYTQNASRIMTMMLKKVVEEGTGKSAGLSVQPCAGKTGTTNNNRDSWFVGYTPYYTTSVWSGYDIPETINLSGGNISSIIWHDFMEYMHLGLKIIDFAEPEYIPEPIQEESESESESETESEEILEEWSETVEEIILPTEEELTAPSEEEYTIPQEDAVDIWDVDKNAW